MEIKSFYEPGSGTWTHLVADKASGKAVIIDPVWVFDPVSGMADTAFIEQVLDSAKEEKCSVEWVLETHAHADHLTAADQVRQRTGARIACSKGIGAVQENFVRVFNMEGTATDGSQFDRLLHEGDVIMVGKLEISVMETPGHTGDSITYLAEDAAFIGDTLFAPAFGTARCDFPGGDARQLYRSIQKLYELPGDTRLFLCHDYPNDGAQPTPCVTVEQCMRENIHCTAATSKQEYVAMREKRDAELSLPRLILPALQVNILAGAMPEQESNGASYLKTPLNRSIEELIKPNRN